MARQAKSLTDTGIKNAKATEKPVKLFDGGGLYLLVEPGGRKGWRLKYRFGGREKLISLGTYPQLSLAEARRKRDKARDLISKGINPAIAKKIEKQARSERQEHTFRKLAENWLERQTNLAASTFNMTKRRLERDVFPAIGSLPINDLNARVILEGVLRPMERRGAVELAHRTRAIISRVLRFGVACGDLERDVTADLRGALKSFERNHMAAPTRPKDVAAILRAIDGYSGTVVVGASLKLHPLVATRPGELRHMEWSEIDFEAGLWNIPAGKMKMKTAHIVPLSRQAIEILQGIYPLTGSGRYVFPSIRTTTKPLSDNTLNSALRRMGISKDELVAHGWRAVFRTLAVEVLGEHVEHVEQQLAHQVSDALGRAYNRTTFIEERRSMMQRWADYLDELKSGAVVLECT